MNEFVNAITKKSYDSLTITQNEFINYYADCNATLPHEKEEYFVDVGNYNNISRLSFQHGESHLVLTMSQQTALLNLKQSFSKKSDKRRLPKTTKAKLSAKLSNISIWKIKEPSISDNTSKPLQSLAVSLMIKKFRHCLINTMQTDQANYATMNSVDSLP
jgi:hypothetical protein